MVRRAGKVFGEDVGRWGSEMIHTLSGFGRMGVDCVSGEEDSIVGAELVANSLAYLRQKLMWIGRSPSASLLDTLPTIRCSPNSGYRAGISSELL